MLGYLWLIIVLPFLGFFLNGLFGKRAGKTFVTAVGCGTVGVAFLLSVGAVYDLANNLDAYRGREASGLRVDEARGRVDLNLFEWIPPTGPRAEAAAPASGEGASPAGGSSAPVATGSSASTPGGGRADSTSDAAAAVPPSVARADSTDAAADPPGLHDVRAALPATEHELTPARGDVAAAAQA